MNTRFLLSLAVVAAIFSSCNKDYNPGTVIPETPGTYSLVSAMAELAVAPKVVTINATTGGTFNGNSGTRYVFPSNAFLNASGTVVAGNIQVTVSEYLKKSDMIFSGILPVSDNEPLLSGGEINVSASQGGQSLKLNPNTTFQANMPGKAGGATGMGLFTGTQDAATGKVNWKPVADSSVGVTVVGIDTIALISNTIDLCNADRFMSNPDFQTFTVTAAVAGTTFSDDSLMGYALYDMYNGAWQLSDASYHIYHEHHVPNIPVHFVICGIVKGNFYGGIAAATPTNGSNYVVTLTKTTPLAFRALVDAL